MNTIELYNLTENPKKLDFRFNNNCLRNSPVLENEIRIRLFFHTIVDFAKNNAEHNTLIEFTMQNFDTPQNSLCYTFTCTFITLNIDKQLLEDIFKKPRKNLEEFEDFSKKYGLNYAIFSSNIKALKINVKQISYSKNIVTLSFFLKLAISAMPSGSIPMQISKNRIIMKSKVLWHNQQSFLKSQPKKLEIEHQSRISIGVGNFQRYSLKVNFLDSPEKLNESTEHLPSLPKSLQNIHQTFSNSFSENYFHPKRPRRSCPVLRAKKSKQNFFNSPGYSHTNKRKVQKFLLFSALRASTRTDLFDT